MFAAIGPLLLVAAAVLVVVLLASGGDDHERRPARASAPARSSGRHDGMEAPLGAWWPRLPVGTPVTIRDPWLSAQPSARVADSAI